MTAITKPEITQADADALAAYVMDTVSASGAKGAVIGLSGGLDSAVVAKICVDALGPEKVLAVFMPSNVTSECDYKDTSDMAAIFGMEMYTVNIQPAVDAVLSLLPEGQSPLDRGNVAARCRMTVLFNYAKRLGYLVFGTSNKSEMMMGYFTKYGDGACDAMLLCDYYKTEVKQIASIIGVPQNIIDKQPSAGLWEGQTDESEMGISYADLDYALSMMESGCGNAEISEMVGIPEEKVASIRSQMLLTSHKRASAYRPKRFNNQ